MKARQPIRLPIVERLTVRGYALYPGPTQQGIDLTFPHGVTVLAGINGIGKTTLLQLLLRMLVGPLNPSKAATRDPGRVSSRQLVSSPKFSYFVSRVPPPLQDDAVATMEFRIGLRSFVVRRAMATMALREVSIEGRRRRNLTDLDLLAEMAKGAGLANAYDFYMVVRYLQFFTEERLPVLWSSSTQFEVFKMLLLDPDVSKDLSKLYADVQRVDSDYRNKRNQLTLKIEAQRAIAATLPATADVSPADLAAKSAELNAARTAADKERRTLDGLIAQRDRLRREHSNQEYEVDEKRRALARSDAAYISQALPGLEDKLQFLMQSLGSGVGCFICGTPGRKQHHEISRQLRSGHCFVCHSKMPTAAKNGVPIKAAEVRKLERILEESNAKQTQLQAELSKMETDAAAQQERMRAALTTVQRLSEEHAYLAARLPGQTASPLNTEIEREEFVLGGLDKERKELTEQYRALVDRAQQSIEAFRDDLSQRIETYARTYLREKVIVRYERNSPFSLATGVSRINIPTFRVAMTSSTHKTEQVRPDQTSVSESQKEFLDLAFRLAVLDMVSDDGPLMLVIETPEASLDTWFMRRAAEMMGDFAAHGTSKNRCVIATSNLNGTPMIGHLLGRGGGTKKKQRGKLINLMELTALPTVLDDEEAKRLFDDEVRQYTDG